MTISDKKLLQLQHDLQELGLYAQEVYPQYANQVIIGIKRLNDAIGQMRNTPPAPRPEAPKKQGPNTDTIQA